MKTETFHDVIFGDAKNVLKKFPDENFQLMITSPPYWNVRDYGRENQIGFGETLEIYMERLNEVWKEVVRTLLPDGKIAVNIGNVYYKNEDEKRRTTANLAYMVWKTLDDYKELRFMGTIYWQKTTSRNGAVLFGSYPYPTNFMISSAVEPIHVFRKVGERKVSKETKEASKVTLEEFRQFRDAIWYINGVEDKHSAAYPYEIPSNLIKMFSFVGDYVLDPFLGSGTTMKAAIDLNRNSVGIEINPSFLEIIEKKVGYKQAKLLSHANNELSYELSNPSFNVFYDDQLDEDALSKLFHRESLKSNNP
jgi:site-specific DNA-methyltransferase (adenine-specific)